MSTARVLNADLQNFNNQLWSFAHTWIREHGRSDFTFSNLHEIQRDFSAANPNALYRVTPTAGPGGIGFKVARKTPAELMAEAEDRLKQGAEERARQEALRLSEASASRKAAERNQMQSIQRSLSDAMFGHQNPVSKEQRRFNNQQTRLTQQRLFSMGRQTFHDKPSRVDQPEHRPKGHGTKR